MISWPQRAAALVAAGCLSLPAAGAPKMAVVAVGNCKSVDLMEDAARLAETLKAKARGEVMDSADLLSRLRPPAGPSAADLQRQLEAGKNDFYEGKLREARKKLDAVLVEAQNLPPGVDRWHITRETQSFRFLIFKQHGQQPAQVEALSSILRVEPKFAFNKDLFAPSARDFLEKTKAELARGPVGKLEVTSRPSGVTVNLDGNPSGVTPFTALLSTGTYEVTLGKERVFSTRHHLTVKGTTKFNVDFNFESALIAEKVVCVPARAEDPRGINAGVRVGKMAQTEAVVLLSLEPRREGGDWLRTTLVEVDGELLRREGGIRVGAGLIPHASLEDLANFVLRGDRGAHVQWTADPPPSYGTLSAPPLVSIDGAPDVPWATSAALRTRGPRRMTPAVWTLGAGAVVAGTLGAIFEVQGANAWRAFNGAFHGAGPAPGDARGLVVLRESGRRDQTAGWVAAGAAVAAAGTAAALYLWQAPTHPRSVFPQVRLSAGPGTLALTGTLR